MRFVEGRHVICHRNGSKWPRLHISLILSISDISSRESKSLLNFSIIDEDLGFEIDDFEAVEEQISIKHEDIPKKNIHGKISQQSLIANLTILWLFLQLRSITNLDIWKKLQWKNFRWSFRKII